MNGRLLQGAWNVMAWSAFLLAALAASMSACLIAGTWGCTEGAIHLEVHAPEIPPEAIKLAVEPGAVQTHVATSLPAIEIPPIPEGLVKVEGHAPVTNDFGAGWVAGGVVAVVLTGLGVWWWSRRHA